MDLELQDLSLAIDSIKDRLCSLERHDTNLEECSEALRQSNDILKRCQQLMQRVADAEKRMLMYREEIKSTNLNIQATLEAWAEYFSMRPNINFRQNVEENSGIEEGLKLEKQRMEKYKDEYANGK